jgi:UDP-N-acetylmuramyl pentapeptide phosphotransferase/UDP-N-acetylglucosamine-1-phosphate transferase
MPEAKLLIWPLAAGVATFLALAGLLQLRRHLPVDVPNARSLHSEQTPRIGGLGMLLGAGAVMVVYLAQVAASSWQLYVATGAALALSLVSLLDDFQHLPVTLRLGVHLAAAGLVASMADLPLITTIIVTLLLVWMTNLYNFMDGSDGLAGSMALVGFMAYAWAAWPMAPEIALVCAMLAAAAAGFLIFNFPPAKVFMGDAGSIPLGFLAGSMGLAGWRADVWSIEFPLLVFFPFIADATYTLIRRTAYGEVVWRAHNKHCYQRLVRMGWSHRKVLFLYLLLMTIPMVANMLAKTIFLSVAELLAFLLLVYLCLITWVEIKWLRYTRLHVSSNYE